MRYPPEQVDFLAAEYVLGTMQGSARRRMESLMRERADVRLAVWRWERVFHGLAGTMKPVQPPKSIWRGIETRISGSATPRRGARHWWPRAALAAVVVAFVAFWLGTLLTPVPGADRIAVFADDSAQALWIVTTDAGRGRLIAETAGVPAAEDSRVYELWALPAGEPPQSLGLLQISPGRYESEIGPELRAAVENSANLAISLEPPGGSPTGLPTGPIVYQAQLLRL